MRLAVGEIFHVRYQESNGMKRQGIDDLKRWW
jgi:hypothetical protein